MHFMSYVRTYAAPMLAKLPLSSHIEERSKYELTGPYMGCTFDVYSMLDIPGGQCLLNDTSVVVELRAALLISNNKRYAKVPFTALIDGRPYLGHVEIVLKRDRAEIEVVLGDEYISWIVKQAGLRLWWLDKTEQQ